VNHLRAKLLDEVFAFNSHHTDGGERFADLRIGHDVFRDHFKHDSARPIDDGRLFAGDAVGDESCVGAIRVSRVGIVLVAAVGKHVFVGEFDDFIDPRAEFVLFRHRFFLLSVTIFI